MNQPPASIEMEQSILASCLIYSEDMIKSLELLKPNDFYKKGHGLIFETISNLYNKKEPVDIVTVSEKLKNKANEIGGLSYLAKLTEMPVAVNIEHTANIIKKHATLRQIINISQETTKKCFEAQADNVEDIIDSLQTKTLELDLDNNKTDFVKISSLLKNTIDDLERRSKSKTKTTGIPSDFKTLDMITCGFQPSDLIILAARPSMGKTALALNIMRNIARNNIKSAIFSLEMANPQLLSRWLAIESGVNSQRFRSGAIETENWKNIMLAASKMDNWPIWIDDAPKQSHHEISRKIRKLYKQEKVKIVFIDYLGFVDGTKSYSKTEEVESITRSLKSLAKELGITVVLLCQLNRQCEMRNDKRPMLSDLRDSGAIEQDADIVMFLYRHERYVKKYDSNRRMNQSFIDCQGKAELNVAKQRNGPCGVVNLKWDEKTTMFESEDF